MEQVNLIFIGSHVSEDNAGSPRQERFINRALQCGFLVTYIKPSGSNVGSYNFESIKSFNSWKLDRQPKVYKGSISSFRYRNYLLPFKYIFLLDMFGSGFFRTILYLFRNRYLFKTNYKLVVSCPSFELALAVYVYSLLINHLKFTVDMRDAWAYHRSLRTYKGLRILVERIVLNRACRVVTVSKYLKEEFEFRHSVFVDLLYNVNIERSNYNLHGSLEVTSFNRKYINICYFGSIPRNFYNLHEFCKGLQLYFESESKQLKFHFYGPCEELKTVLRSYPLIEHNFVFKYSISHRDALIVMQTCDVVLFLGYNYEKNAGMVSTKIFEYFNLKLKILAFGVREDSDLEFLIFNVCGKRVLINDSQEFFIYLQDALEDLEKLPVSTNREFLVKLDEEYGRFFHSL